jgi:hypothetical protein
MNNSDLTYKNTTQFLKNNPPKLENAEDLRNSILSEIEHLPKNSKRQRVLRLYGLLNGIAATFLLCFLLSETVLFKSENLPITTTVNYSFSINYTNKEQVLSTIRQQIENRNRKEQLLTKIQNYENL